MNTNVDFEEHTVDKEKRQKKSYCRRACLRDGALRGEQSSAGGVRLLFLLSFGECI